VPTFHATPAPFHRNLFSSFWLAAHWIWERRQTAKRAGFPFSEETITETILLDLATQNPVEIVVQAFNKRQEGLTGADWEWCIYNKNENRFLRMLVQAKVLDDLDDEYAHIDRKIGNTGVRQIDRLLDTARRRGIPALYAFYNHLSDARRVPTAACQCYGCLECWGSSVALAIGVQSGLPDKTFNTLRKISVPWICLLCPNAPLGVRVPSAPDRVAEALQKLFNAYRTVYPTIDIDSDVASFTNLIRSEPPSYFSEVRSLQSVESPKTREARVERMAAENPAIGGVVLLTDLTEEPE
jgi:hypothetical protein